MHEIHQRAGQTPNEPGVTWRDLIVGAYMGMLPNSMCEEPYLLTAEFDAATLRSDAKMELVGLLSYATNPTLCRQFAFTATVNTNNLAITIVETEGKPEE